MSNDTKDRTLWVGNLSDKVSEDILYELFLQAGPLDKVSIAKERDGRLRGFAFVTFEHVASVPYTIQLMNGLPLYGRQLNLQTRPGSVHQQAQQQHQAEMMKHVMNPYQNQPPAQEHSPHSPQVMQNPLANPYINQSIRNNQSGMAPQFHKSHTWHGSDLSSAMTPADRDRDVRGNRDNRGYNRDNFDRNRDRGHHSHRDRSGGRHRGEHVEDYRNSPSSDNYYGGENMDSRRQRVLDKQNRVIQSYKDTRHGGGGRKGRY